MSGHRVGHRVSLEMCIAIGRWWLENFKTKRTPPHFETQSTFYDGNINAIYLMTKL